VQDLLRAIEKDSLVEIKRLLKSKDYDLNSEVEIGTEYDLDEYDEIPLVFYLIQKGASLEAIKLLIDNGMDIHTTTREGVGAVDIAIKYRRADVVELCKDSGIDLTTTKRKSGLTPLMLATSFNDIDMMKYLISLGANPKERDKSGMNAIDYAYKLGQKRAAKFLEELDNSDL
jgi:ankyrin repeat protein